MLAVLLLLALPFAAARAETLDSVDSDFQAELRLGEAALRLNDPRSAVNHFLIARELESHDRSAFPGVGEASWVLRRYADAAWAWDLLSRTQPLKDETRSRHGQALLVIGDGERAWAVLNVSSDHQELRRWRIVAAFATGGYERAQAASLDQPISGLAPMGPAEEQGMVLRVVEQGAVELERRAAGSGLLYARLFHASLLYAALDHASDGRLEWFWEGEIGQQRWDVLWRVIRAYRALPLKPLPPRRAIDAAMEAERRRESPESITFLKQALRAAPWWAEAHYNMALLDDARLIYAEDLRYIKKEDGDATAQERIFALALAPDGPKAKDTARELQRLGIKFDGGEEQQVAGNRAVGVDSDPRRAERDQRKRVEALRASWASALPSPGFFPSHQNLGTAPDLGAFDVPPAAASSPFSRLVRPRADAAPVPALRLRRAAAVIRSVSELGPEDAAFLVDQAARALEGEPLALCLTEAVIPAHVNEEEINAALRQAALHQAGLAKAEAARRRLIEEYRALGEDAGRGGGGYERERRTDQLSTDYEAMKRRRDAAKKDLEQETRIIVRELTGGRGE